MEHYRSTLATTAIAVFGLVAAAHILHPGNYEMQPQRVRPPVSAAVEPAAWVDPPRELRVAAAPEVVAHASDAPSLPAPSLLAPRMIAALAPGATMAPTLPSTIVQPAVRVQKVSQRRRTAQRTRTRQASLERGAVPASAEPTASAPAQKPRIDPIGDLIRGLGFGNEG